jgi:hypothetical protein
MRNPHSRIMALLLAAAIAPVARLFAEQRVEGRTVRTRPLCPYPQVARCRGTGNIDEAVNFACLTPPPLPVAGQ